MTLTLSQILTTLASQLDEQAIPTPRRHTAESAIRKLRAFAENRRAIADEIRADDRAWFTVPCCPPLPSSDDVAPATLRSVVST
jgi:hypothetical protein